MFHIKRGMCFFVVLIFSYLLLGMECYAKEFREINVYDNGRMRIALQNEPFLKDNILYLPLREMIEYCGAGGLRYAKPNIIIEQDGGQAIIVLTPDDEIATLNDAIIEMSAPPILKDWYTYIPIEYLYWTDLGRSFFVNYEYLDDTLNVYLRNNTLENDQKNWVDFDFDLKSLTKSSDNTILSANRSETQSLTWEYEFQGKEQDYFMDADHQPHLVDFIITMCRCKFYTEPGVQAVTIPFSQEYEMTFIIADSMDNDLLNRIYQYQDSYIRKGTTIKIPVFSITDGNKTYLLNEDGFFCQNITANQDKKKDLYELDKNKIDYTFQKPFYFVISDKKTNGVLYKGWYGVVS